MSADTTERAVRQHADALVVLGMSQVILGGLVAAVTRPLALAHGSWLAAYLVLVGGVAQYTMGRVTALHEANSRTVVAQLVGWNLGNALVMTGTLTQTPSIVDAGGVVLLAVLALLLRVELTSPVRLPNRVRRLYLALLCVLTVSVPIGLVLAHLRAG